MLSKLSPTLRRFLTLILFVAVLAVVWLSVRWRHPAQTPTFATSTALHHADSATSARAQAPTPSAVARPPTASASRQDIIDGVLAVYRKTQLNRELELEQQRYGTDYWKPDRNGAELAALRTRREAMLRQLSEEANRAIAAYFPNESVEPITLRPMFNDDEPAPNVTYLSPTARARFEEALLRLPDIDRRKADEQALQVLSGSDLEWYHRWNDRNAVALREQLLGFDPTEREFNALLQQNRVLGEAGDSYGGGFALEGQLGRERLAQLEALSSPAMHTALQDLNRAGLALANAEWLAATRQRAATEIQQVWQDTTLSDPAKAQQVSALQRQYGAAIDARLGRRGSTLEEMGRSP